MSLRPCAACARHYYDHEPACPFCHASSSAASLERPKVSKRLALGGLTLLTAVSATACYGAPPLEPPPPGAFGSELISQPSPTLPADAGPLGRAIDLES